MKLEELYSLRNNFSIIGLTGRKGSGCSTLAKLFERESISKLNIREPKELKKDGRLISNSSRKYRLCYNYLEKNWKPYKTIKYLNVVLLEVFNRIQSDKEEFEKLLNEIKICYSSVDGSFTKEIKNVFYNNREILEKLNKLNAPLNKIKGEGDLKVLYEVFFTKDNFDIISNQFYDTLSRHGIAQRVNFFHRVSNNLRGSGQPWSSHDKKYTNCNDLSHIYYVAEIINRLIKSWKFVNSETGTHIIIDSLRNSLELLFFKERYSAFYMVSVNGEFRHNHISETIKSRYPELSEERIEEAVKEILDLDNVEYTCNDYKKGQFWAPDVENCIQKCDYHFINRITPIEKDEWEKDKFYSLDEQVLKLSSLIKQPGIITPSAIERSMQVAYNAKYNSGCISRQVGAIVTDRNYSIKAVGWNDVPYGATPCNLRNVNDLSNGQENFDEEAYSDFELNNCLNTQSAEFGTYLQETFSGKVDGLDGKNHSFCFKAAFNSFEGEKNQVHTRSLHAEENAMMQIAKNGGEGLQNGYLFTTASPCELCSKKAFQLGVTKIFYIDPYPGISEDHILGQGRIRPTMIPFYGAIGRAFHKLYEPYMAYKDELALLTGIEPKIRIDKSLSIFINSLSKNLESKGNKLSDEIILKISRLKKMGRLQEEIIVRALEKGLDFDEDN